MSEWKTIDSAPANIPVRVGKWEFFGGERKWVENEGVVWSSALFGLLTRKEYAATYHYWRPLPDAPDTP